MTPEFITACIALAAGTAFAVYMAARRPKPVRAAPAIEDNLHSIAGTQRAKVLECLRLSEGGLTDHEIQTSLGMNPSTQRPRRIELVEAGLVKDSGLTRKTPSGRSATVWIAGGETS